MPTPFVPRATPSVTSTGFVTLALLAAALAVVVAIFAEVLLCFPLDRALYLGAGALIALPWLLGWLVDGRRERIRSGTSCLVALVTLTALHLVPWSSRKPFLQDLRRVQPGMTLTQVEEIMAGYRRGSGVRTDEGPLFLSDAVIYRHSDEARFNRDWGIVRFERDRVVSVEFSAD